MTALGIDIGGSGVKGNLVDTATGALLSKRLRIATPRSGSTEAVGAVVAEIADHFRRECGDETLPVGCGFPGVIRSGVVSAATHLDKAWLGADVVAILSEALGSPVTVLNDADAAGAAEIAFGSAKNRSGTILMITLGTGIGSGMFRDGRLVPNFELGMLELGGHHPIEDRVAYRVFKQRDLSWKKWAKRLNRYLRHVNALFAPDLIVLGGGGVNKWSRFGHRLDVPVDVVPAHLGNHAGIVGAALAAVDPDVLMGDPA
ncbi:MAG: ROK family protein [bacterium]|nr:ROK family protein [bacterium]MDE0601542.1 ROK family protein [bacterium]